MAHRVKDRFDHAEGKRKSNKDIRQDNRAGSEHELNAMRSEQTTQRAVWSPKQQQRKTGDGSWNCSGQRDRDDESVAAPEVVTRKDVRSEKTEDNVESSGPEAGGHRELECKQSFRRTQRAPKLVQSVAGPENEDRSQRQKDQRQHHEHEHADAQGSSDVEPTHMPH